MSHLNFEDVVELLQLDKNQIRAFRKLRKAYSECARSGIYFHQVLETLQAFNGHKIESINDSSSGGYCTQEMAPPSLNIGCGWADDRHYVHFKKTYHRVEG